MKYKTKTPILIICFNRPDNLFQVLKSVKRVNPKRLYFAIDGPRGDNKNDIIKCNEVKELCDNIDWCQDIRKKFRKSNVGCKKNIEEAISWAFENEEQLIILEDDIVPSVSFYRFCDELLDKYKHESKVWLVSGYCICESTLDDSYYFSKTLGIWGWATWKNRWENSNLDMSKVMEKNTKEIILKSYAKRLHGNYQYNNMIRHLSTDWDYYFSFNILYNDGVSIAPKKSLVQNIGFGNDALHGGRKDSPFAQITAKEIDFPLKHPINYEVNLLNDTLEMNMRFRNGYPFWYAYLGQIYRRFVPRGDIKVIGVIKKVIQKILKK